nr:hypothetical protein [Tanacetum cinerariifolium]
MSLTFADTHIMVAYLNKSDASEGFNQVIHFLNASYIKYALTINPHIYDVTRLQALVDKKKVVITEATIDCLPNEEIFAELARMGYEKTSTKLTFYKAFFSSQWKFLIHTILQSMSAKRISWNEFSSAMASAVICLSTSRKFNFSKYIFESLVRNVDSNSKFFMYHRFIQKQLGVIEEHGDAEEQVQDDVDDAAAQGADTAVQGNDAQHTPPQSPLIQWQPLPQAQPQAVDFQMSLLQEALDACAALARRVEHLERLKKVVTSQRIDSSDDTVMEDASNQGRMIDDLDKDDVVALMNDKKAEKKAEEAKVTGDDQVKERQAEIYHIDMDHASKVLSMQEDEPEVHEVVDVVTTAKLITEVVTAASESVTAVSTAAKPQVPAAIITAAPVRVVAVSTKKRKGVVIRDLEEESTTIIPVETKSKDKGKGIMVEEPKPLKKKQQVEMDEEYVRKLHEELNRDIYWNVAIDHVKQKAKDDPFMPRYQVIKKRPQTEAQARRNMIMYLKNVVGFKLDYFKGMSYDDIRPIFEAKFNSNIKFLLKTKKQLEEEENKAT